MTKRHANTPPLKQDRSFEALYNEISHDWQAKSERLQERRWQHINEHEAHQKPLTLLRNL